MFLPRLVLLAAASLGITAASGLAQVQLTATAGTSTSASYTTLRLAFDKINDGTHKGAITIDLTGNTNEGTTSATLDASGRFTAVYTSVVIRPSGGAARTISGATTAGNAMIVYNGASNVTIDGLNSGGNSLTITNTTASATAVTGTLRLRDGASNNVITRATVLGSFTGPATTTGGTIVFANDAVTGNGCDNNTISLCNLGPAGASLPTKAIQGSGATSSAAAGNSGMVITGNNIYDYFAPTGTSAGIYLDVGCANWTISNNRFYQTAARAFTGTAAAPHAAIFVNESQATTGAQGFAITGNVIGFANAAGTGTYTLSGGAGAFTGIFFSGIADGALSTISNNTIANVSLTGVTSSGGNAASPFVGIRVNPGNAEVSDNLIGSDTAADSLVFSNTSTAPTHAYGIFSNAAGAAFTANRNRVGGMTMGSTATTASVLLGGLGMEATADFAFNADANVVGTAAAPMRNSSASTGAQAVGLASASVRCNFTGNTIQNLSAGGAGTVDTSSVNGIRITATSRAHTVARNVIFDLFNLSTSTSATVSGIQFAGSTAGTSLISQNVIRQIGFTSTNASSRVSGIALAGGANTVERNFIHSFRAIAAGEVSGLYINGGSGLYRNNMIRLGILPNGASDTNGVVTYGINQLVGSPDSYFHNSVYIGGSGVAGTARSAAMRNGDPNSTILINNNVFVNARSNASGGTGKHFGILLENSNFTTDYNVILASGTGGLFGARRSTEYAHLVPGWQADVGDEHSFEADPQFINPAADFTAVDLHILPTAATPVESNGLPLSAAETSDDFDGQVRANFTPVDIGADAGNFVTAGGQNPVAGPLSRTVSQGQTLVIPTAALLAASSDPAGLALSVTGAGPSSAQDGTVTFATNVTYTPPSPQFTGADSFYYSIRDSAGRTDVGVINVTVQAPAFPALAGSVTLTPGANGAFAATFRGGVPGLSYTIEYTDSLTVAFAPLLDANSQPVAVTADGTGSFNFAQAAPAVPKRFYRARRQP